MLKIYFAGKFNIDKSKTKELHLRLVNDYRSILLGDSKKLTIANNEVKLKEYPIYYNGCFYCEQASNGDYTSTDCETVLKKEMKDIMESDIFCCVFDLHFSVGSVVELINAAFAKKRIVIFYKNEDSDYTIKSDYWFAITDALEICKNNNTKIEVFGYNENVLPSLYNWLNNLVFTKKYVCIRENMLEEYLKLCILKKEDIILKKRVFYYETKDSNKFLVERYENGLIILKATKELKLKGIVDVTQNELYIDSNIEKGNVMVSNAILEGTDGVGKTTTIEELVQQGIICKDRSETICKYMLFDVDMEVRCKAYKEYLEHTTSEFVIFLVNNNKKELEARINARNTISEFDKLAYEYNILYQKTYLKMQEYQIKNPIELADCTNLSIEKQVKKVKDIILRREKTL